MSNLFYWTSYKQSIKYWSNKNKQIPVNDTNKKYIYYNKKIDSAFINVII